MSEASGHDFEHLPPAGARLAHIFARPKVLAGFCVIALGSFGWFYIAVLLTGMSGPFNGASLTQVLCRPLSDTVWSSDRLALMASMWCAMTFAMMLPSAAPMIMTYAGIADTAARKGESIVSPFVLVAGYATVWLGSSMMAALVQAVLVQSAFLDAGMVSASDLLSGAIFLGAGLYQFSSLKNSCLLQCQQPFPFFFANWSTRPSGVFRLGLRQGVYCLGCCWAMMLLMFAVGVMNVAWMAGLAIVMTIEKLLPGRRFSRAVGLALIGLGAAIVAVSFVGAATAMTTS